MQINCAVVVAYMFEKKVRYDDYYDTILAERVESAHPYYAISWHNSWRLKQSDYVVTYITYTRAVLRIMRNIRRTERSD